MAFLGSSTFSVGRRNGFDVPRGLPAHRAKAEAITEVVMDMSPAYIAGVQAHFPNVRIVFDLFHIMKLAGEALDAVRKSLRKQGADLTGGLWALSPAFIFASIAASKGSHRLLRPHDSATEITSSFSCAPGIEMVVHFASIGSPPSRGLKGWCILPPPPYSA